MLTALAMNLPRYLSRSYEPDLLHLYVDSAAIQGLELSFEAVFQRYRMCLLMSVIVATGMRNVGMPMAMWSYLFVNALHAATDHDAVEFLG